MAFEKGQSQLHQNTLQYLWTESRSEDLAALNTA